MSIPQALGLAQQHLSAGRLAEAAQILEAILQAAPGETVAHHLQGLLAYQVGNLAAAEACFRRAVALDGRSVEYRNNLSGILNILGRSAEAEAVAREALRLEPANLQCLNNLGVALQAQRRLDEAIAVLRQAVAIGADFLDVHVNLANATQLSGRIEESIALNRGILAHWPNHANAYLNIGAALQQLGRIDEAAQAYYQVLAIDPANSSALNNLGTVLELQGKLPEAEVVYRKALAMNPQSASLHYNIGNLLQAMSRLDEAAEAYKRALAIQPDYYEPQNNLGNLLQLCGRSAEAEAAYRRCLEMRPNEAGVLQNLANVHQVQGRLAEAEEEYRRLIDTAAPSGAVHSNLASSLQAQGRIDEAREHFQRAIDLSPTEDSLHSNLLLCLQYSTGITPAELAVAHAVWEDRHGVPRRAYWRKHENSRDPERPLRVGFLSADLWQHTVGHLVTPLLENLDHSSFAVICYYDGGRQDISTERLHRTASLWRDVCGMPEQRLAELIRADAVDILFDLAGHTAANRLPVFARKPAPVQISWAGYAGTTGLAAMDYVLGDRYQAPEGDERYYSERVLRMPDGYLCYGPPDGAPEVGPLPALARGQFTFGSFNNPAKFNREVVALWAKIMKRVPGSRLMMKYRGLETAAMKARVGELFAAEGIPADRLELVTPSPHPAVLAAYNDVDLALDPFPYSGGITTCEAIWMGVPVITCPGATFAGRHSFSHLSNAGLGQFVARDLGHYEEMAAEWAGDLKGLAQVRAGMRAQVAASPLCDARRFAENCQRLLREAWRRWAESGE